MKKIGELVSPEASEEFMQLWKVHYLFNCFRTLYLVFLCQYFWIYISQEYESQETAESHFVKDLDKFDMIAQAYEYEKQDGKPAFLQEFFDSTKGWSEEIKVIWNCRLYVTVIEPPF